MNMGVRFLLFLGVSIIICLGFYYAMETNIFPEYLDGDIIFISSILYFLSSLFFFIPFDTMAQYKNRFVKFIRALILIIGSIGFVFLGMMGFAIATNVHEVDLWFAPFCVIFYFSGFVQMFIYQFWGKIRNRITLDHSILLNNKVKPFVSFISLVVTYFLCVGLAYLSGLTSMKLEYYVSIILAIGLILIIIIYHYAWGDGIEFCDGKDKSIKTNYSNCEDDYDYDYEKSYSNEDEYTDSTYNDQYIDNRRVSDRNELLRALNSSFCYSSKFVGGYDAYYGDVSLTSLEASMWSKTSKIEINGYLTYRYNGYECSEYDLKEDARNAMKNIEERIYDETVSIIEKTRDVYQGYDCAYDINIKLRY